jgi:hypothetical protein
MKTMNKYQKGAMTAIFLAVVTLVLTLILAATQSQLLLSLRRSESAADTLIANYDAESEVNDSMSKLIGGYIGPGDFTLTKEINGTSLVVVGEESDGGKTQVVTVTARRASAVSKVQATRKVQSLKKVNNVEIVLGLDCTESMGLGATCDNCFSRPSRLEALEEAATDFIDNLAALPDSDKFKLGIMVFGIDAKWLNYGGVDFTPDSGLSFDQIKSGIQASIGVTRPDSSACQTVMDSTSIGTAYITAQEFFDSSEDSDTKQIEIVITDGYPNSSTPEADCTTSAFCPAFPIDTTGQNYCESNEYGWTCHDYESYKDGPYEEGNYNDKAFKTCVPLAKELLSCALATTDTFVPMIAQNGVRNPEVDAYAVTIFPDPPSDVVQIFRNYTTPNGYFNASRASQLKNILNNVLNEILKDRTTVSMERLIPTPK